MYRNVNFSFYTISHDPFHKTKHDNDYDYYDYDNDYNDDDYDNYEDEEKKELERDAKKEGEGFLPGVIFL